MPWQLLIYPLLPVAAVFACYKSAILRRAGVVLLCYAAGILLGNVGFFPDTAAPYQELLASIAVAFALPLLLFTMDVPRWFALAGKAVLSMAAACLATMVMASLGSVLIRGAMANSWQVGGIAAGVYTGGTPNAAAIRTALGMRMDTFVVFHTYDTVVSVVYIIFCMTVARRVFSRWLPPFEAVAPDALVEEQDETALESIAAFGDLLRIGAWPALVIMSLLSALIMLTGLLASRLVADHAASAVAIVVITTLGIGASFVKPIRKRKLTFHWGMYVIYLFCCIVGSMVDANILTRIHLPILVMVTLVIFGGMALHAALCRLLRVDTDTFIITSVSAICSPPFVPPVAVALQNKHILLSGITTGIIGYAAGNYLGILVAYFMRLLLA